MGRHAALPIASDITADDPRPLNDLAREAAQALAPEPIVAALETAFRLLLGADEVRLLGVSRNRAGALETPAAGGAALLDGTLFVPVGWGGTVRNVVVATWTAPRELDPSELELAQLSADQAAAGFARLEAEERRAIGSVQDRAVVRAAGALNASLDLQEILPTLVLEAAMALDADMSGFYLGDGERGAVATAGHRVPDDWHGARIASGVGAAGRVLETGEPFVRTGYEHAGTAPEHPPADRFPTALAVPIAWDGRLRGVLSIGWTTRREVHDDDLGTLEAIAGLAGIACRNAEAYEHVQHVARTDALTGVLNHGAMQIRIREEIARARRDQAPLGAVILDLDDFKRVNDTRGHAAGDELLRRVATLLQGELRPYDQVARYGGDEFVLLLPGSDEATTAQVAERCRDAIGGACSIGVAAWYDGLDSDALLEQADRALMLAKRTGKGRVAIANPEVERELALLQSRSGSPAAVQALAAAIEERDGYTREHSELVVHLSRGVAMMLGLAAENVERVANAALLHDVGKLAMPSEILGKTGPLDPGEWQVMAEHPIVGERILARTSDLAPIAPIVRHEHEHWDGSGYPDGLERLRIPVGSRVILACDAYAAMITPRPYRPALRVDAAVAELRAGAGSKFDPEVVDALLDLLGHRPPQVPDRSEGSKLAALPPRAPTRRRSRRGSEPDA